VQNVKRLADAEAEPRHASAAFFRRQADLCLRLSLISSDDELCNRWIMMAEDYKRKAAAMEADPKSAAANAMNQNELRVSAALADAETRLD